MRNTLQLILISFILLFNAQYASAQQIISGDTSYNKFRNSIIGVQRIYTRKEQPSTKDTLTGTAMLLRDGNKLYLVTTKKLLQANIYGKDQLASNDSVFLKIEFKKFINLNGLSDKNSQKSAVLFSDDELDIAVISLQKNAHKNLVTGLLTRYKPLSITHMDTSTNWHTNDWLLVHSVADFAWPKSSKAYGTRFTGGGGASVAQIDHYDTSPYFTIKHPPASGISPGNNGGEVVANDKLIGMLRNATGFESNLDIIKTPYYVTHNGKAIKAAYIVRLLRKLQMIENNPDFDN